MMKYMNKSKNTIPVELKCAKNNNHHFARNCDSVFELTQNVLLGQIAKI